MIEPRRARRRKRPPHPDLVPEEFVLSSSIDALLATQGLTGVRALAAVDARWVDIVGQSIATHCRPQRVEGDVLVVFVDQPGLATELSFLSSAIVSRVSEVLGAGIITSVNVRVRGRLDVD